MRRVFGWSIVTVMLALAACAATGDEGRDGTLPPTTVEAGDAHHAPDVSSDVQDAAADAATDADAYVPECSEAGWCTTRLPADTAFTFTDVWPLEKTAFATGFPTGQPLGGAIAEYDGEQWRLVASLPNARVVWAPSADQVWAGGDASIHGALKRGIRSAGSWTWTDMLPGEDHILDIWGAGAGDVYVLAVSGWSGNPDECSNCLQRVYHVDAAGASSLVLEGDARFGPWGRQSEQGPSGLWIDRVTGTSANDVWIIGHRGWCGYLAHKSGSTFETLVDALPGPWPAVAADGGITSSCTAVGDAGVWTDWFFRDWVHAAAAGPGELAISIPSNHGVTNRRVHRVKRTSEGGVEVTPGASFTIKATIFENVGSSPYQLYKPTAIWPAASGDVYVAGFGAVLRNPAVFEDAGAFTYSSTAIRGSLLDKQFLAIRGTAANNVWVVGEFYALHKTTP